MNRVARLCAVMAATGALLLAGCGDSGTSSHDAGTPPGNDIVVGGMDKGVGGMDVPPVGMDKAPGTDTIAPTTDMVAPGHDMVGMMTGPGSYRMKTLKVMQAGAAATAANTNFPQLVSMVLSLSLGGQGATLGIPTLNIAAKLSTTAAGPVMVTVCQADDVTDPMQMGKPATTDHLKCRDMPAPALATGTIDAGGKLTTDPKDFTFAINVGGNAVNLTLKQFAISGTIDMTGIGGMDGTVTAQLLASDLCQVTIMATAVGAVCGGATTVNLLDWVDGDTNMCGQDNSSGGMACTPSMDAATHNPPDVDPGMATAAYNISGTFSMETWPVD